MPQCDLHWCTYEDGLGECPMCTSAKMTDAAITQATVTAICQWLRKPKASNESAYSKELRESFADAIERGDWKPK